MHKDMFISSIDLTLTPRVFVSQTFHIIFGEYHIFLKIPWYRNFPNLSGIAFGRGTVTTWVTTCAELHNLLILLKKLCRHCTKCLNTKAVVNFKTLFPQKKLSCKNILFCYRYYSLIICSFQYFD